MNKFIHTAHVITYYISQYSNVLEIVAYNKFFNKWGYIQYNNIPFISGTRFINAHPITAYTILFESNTAHSTTNDVSIIFPNDVDPRFPILITISIETKYFGRFVATIKLATQTITDCERFTMRLEKIEKDFDHACENLSAEIERINQEYHTLS